MKNSQWLWLIQTSFWICKDFSTKSAAAYSILWSHVFTLFWPASSALRKEPCRDACSCTESCTDRGGNPAMEGCRMLQDVTGCYRMFYFLHEQPNVHNQMYTWSPLSYFSTYYHILSTSYHLLVSFARAASLGSFAGNSSTEIPHHVQEKLGTNQKPLKHFETVFTFDLVTFTYIIWLYLVWMHTSLSGPVDITVEKLGSRKSPTSRRNIFRKHPGRHCACWKRQLSVLWGRCI